MKEIKILINEEGGMEIQYDPGFSTFELIGIFTVLRDDHILAMIQGKKEKEGDE